MPFSVPLFPGLPVGKGFGCCHLCEASNGVRSLLERDKLKNEDNQRELCRVWLADNAPSFSSCPLARNKVIVLSIFFYAGCHGDFFFFFLETPRHDWSLEEAELFTSHWLSPIRQPRHIFLLGKSLPFCACFLLDALDGEILRLRQEYFFFSRNRRALVGRRKNSTSTWLALVNYQPVCVLSFLTLHSTIAISMVREHDKKLRDNSWLESSHAPTNASSSEAHTS